MKTIAIASMSGSRNRGCEALVRGTLDAIAYAFPDEEVIIELHSEDPHFDQETFETAFTRYYRQLPSVVQNHSHRPRLNRLVYTAIQLAEQMAPRSFGRFKSFSHMRKADLIIVTGGDVLTSDYGAFPCYSAPLHLGPPCVILAHTIGEFTAADEAYWNASLANLALCTVRESLSKAYIERISPGLKVEQYADLAFALEPSSVERVREILEVEHRFPMDGGEMIALSVSAGILSFKKDVDSAAYFDALVRFVDRRNAEGKRIVLVPHVQDRAAHNNDLFACLSILRRVARPDMNVALSTPLDAAEFKAVIGRTSCLLGARTHATIASMSQGIPTVAIAYSRKAWGIMHDFYGEENARALTLAVESMTADGLEAAYHLAMKLGPMRERAAEMRESALGNYKALARTVQCLF